VLIRPENTVYRWKIQQNYSNPLKPPTGNTESELKRLEKAIQKREDRMQRLLDKSDENAASVDGDSNEERTE
jgi:hypothetical protein